MEEGNDRGDNLKFFNDNRSSAEMITNDVGALRAILSMMEFDDLLKARLVCKIWNKESGFFIKKRINWINFARDSRLKQYAKSKDRYLLSSIKLNLGKLSAKVLAKCDLEGVQKLCLSGIPDQHYRRRVEPDWPIIWNVKEKILNLLQWPNNINSLFLHFRFPVEFTDMEADFLLNLMHLKSLSIIDDSYFNRPNDIGSIIISRCSSLKHLQLQDIGLLFLDYLTERLNKRKENGLSNLILSILPEIEIILDEKNLEEFNQLAMFRPRFETLKLRIKFDKHATQQQLNETFKAAETILENTADILKELHFSFKYEGYQNNDEFQLKVPPFFKLRKLQLGVSVEGNHGANLKAEQFYQLPNAFPSLDHLIVATNVTPFRGKVLLNLDKLTYADQFKTYKVEHLRNIIPKPPPTFPSLRAVDCIDEVTEEFLRFVFTNLTSIQELKIKLQGPPEQIGFRRFVGPYFDAWGIFTGGAQPPPNVAPTLYSEQPDSDDEDESDEEDEISENPVSEEVNVEEHEHLVASLENFSHLRELEIINATLRDIQAVTFMTQLKKMQKLDKLSFTVRFYKKPTDIKKYIECIVILKKYHRRVVTIAA